MKTHEEIRQYKREWERAWRKRNPKLAKAKADKYRTENRERIRLLVRLNYPKIREHRLAKSREEYALDKEKFRIRARKHYHANKHHRIRKWTSETRRQSFRRRYAADPEFKLRHQLRSRLRYALMKSKVKGTISVRHLLGCSLEFLKGYLEGQFQKGMTWENYGEWHMDHVFPCASFDLTKTEEQQRCFHYTNMQPMWARQNIQKGATVPTAHQPRLF